MFMRERKKPIPLQKKDAAIPRLPQSDRRLPALRYSAARDQKGFNGERKLDYHLRGLPDKFSVLNDVALKVFERQFQIDSVITSPHAIYMNEVKSYEGTVTFDTNLKQLIQENGEKIDGRKYPITQVENNQFLLLRWLQMRHLGGLPIYYFISFSEHSTIIKVLGDEKAIKKAVSYVDEVPLRIMQMDEQLARNRPRNIQFQNRINNEILRNCHDFDSDVLHEFGIKKDEILPGVQCPTCKTLGMERLRYNWQCKKCGTFSKDAHLNALCDRALLIDREITNKQCRDFLIVNRSAANTLLKGAGLIKKSGTKRWILDLDKLRRR
ncbi:nuclease-related domain-containing protein [Pseudogracilibacillus sp. SO30301A]|uniref:nuclease-related domain-containing protein n=1 Tax=Pseudogracilibacillus sp. SO30301A TaxID=3098291 RepID=UPI00300DC095